MNEIKATIARIIFGKNDEVTFILCITGLLISIGFLFGDANNNNYISINSLAPFFIWSILFLVYGILKGLSIFKKLPFIIGAIGCALGLWLWSYIFLSFVLFDPVPLTVTEILLAVPVLAEIWVLAALLSDKGDLWT